MLFMEEMERQDDQVVDKLSLQDAFIGIVEGVVGFVVAWKVTDHIYNNHGQNTSWRVTVRQSNAMVFLTK